MGFQAKYIGLMFFFLSLSWAENTFSQSKTNIVTKEINESFEITSKHKIFINAEKADIKIIESKNNELNLNLKLISKNKDLELAKKELKYLPYAIKESRQEVIIRNFIRIENGELTSSIKAIYTIEIPANVQIHIINTLGDINISGITGNYTLDVKYGNILIKESTGNFKINQHIGDLIISNSNLICEINTENVSNNFQSNKGTFVLRTNMGSLNFELNKNISILDLNSIGTQINLSNSSCFEYNWNIVSESGTLYVNECSIKEKINVIIDNRVKNLNKTEFKYKSNNPNNIKIVNKYSNIFIN